MAGNSEIVEACRLAHTGFEANRREEPLALLAPDVAFEARASLPYGGS